MFFIVSISTSCQPHAESTMNVISSMINHYVSSVLLPSCLIHRGHRKWNSWWG